MKKLLKILLASASVPDAVAAAANARSRSREVVLMTLGALALFSGFAVAAQAATSKHRHHHPRGAVRLPASRVNRVGGVLCGNVRGHWIPGGMAGSGYFLSDIQQAQNYRVLARRARGATRRADLARAKSYTVRAGRRLSLCTPAGGRGSSWTPPGAGTPPTPSPLRFDLSRAIGLALTSQPSYAALHSAPRPVGALHRAIPATVARHRARSAAAADLAAPSGSTLQKVDAAGRLAPTVVSGSAAISHFLIAPDNKVYVVFSTPVNLADTSHYAWPGCLLAQVDPSAGTPTCVDSSLSLISWTNMSGGPGIQFDSTGAIYYSGSTTSGQTVLRRYDGSTTRDLITGNVWVNSFSVTASGTVVVSGTTASTGAAWTRRISPSGSLATLANTSASWSSVFPDGNVYFGSYPGVARYLTAEDQLDSKWWIANSSTSVGTSETIDTHPICDWPAAGPMDFCSGSGSYLKWEYSSDDGHEYAIAGMGGGTLVQLFPTLRFLSSGVKTARVATGVPGANLAIAGTNAAGQNVLTLYNTANDTERELIGPGSEIEIYHLNYVADGSKILFDGLRFSDNRYVIGEYDLTTNQLSVVSSSSIKWADLQSFGSV